MAIFRGAVASRYTRDHYERFLKKFLDYEKLDADSFVAKGRGDPAWLQNEIVDYFLSVKKRVEKGELKQNSVRNFSKPIRLFCDMNDLTALNWKKLNRLLPSKEVPADDRAPTVEELLRLMEYPDRRLKLVVLSMCSGGFRLGSWDYLNWGDIRPVYEKNEDSKSKIIAASLTIYRGEPEQYETYISREAYQEIVRYIEYRKSQGERINPKTPVLRDLIRGDRGGFGEPHIAKRLNSTGLGSLLSQALISQGLRKKLQPGEKRHEFSLSKAFRKFHETALGNSGISVIHLGILRGDANGLRANYSRPSNEELLKSYLKALPRLNILTSPPEVIEIQPDASNETLRTQMIELEKKVQSYESLLKETLVELRRYKNIKAKERIKTS